MFLRVLFADKLKKKKKDNTSPFWIFYTTDKK